MEFFFIPLVIIWFISAFCLKASLFFVGKRFHLLECLKYTSFLLFCCILSLCFLFFLKSDSEAENIIIYISIFFSIFCFITFYFILNRFVLKNTKITPNLKCIKLMIYFYILNSISFFTLYWLVDVFILSNLTWSA